MIHRPASRLKILLNPPLEEGEPWLSPVVRFEQVKHLQRAKLFISRVQRYERNGHGRNALAAPRDNRYPSAGCRIAFVAIGSERLGQRVLYRGRSEHDGRLEQLSLQFLRPCRICLCGQTAGGAVGTDGQRQTFRLSRTCCSPASGPGRDNRSLGHISYGPTVL